jgi:hypothetical protein
MRESKIMQPQEDVGIKGQIGLPIGEEPNPRWHASATQFQ